MLRSFLVILCAFTAGVPNLQQLDANDASPIDRKTRITLPQSRLRFSYVSKEHVRLGTVLSNLHDQQGMVIRSATSLASQEKIANRRRRVRFGGKNYWDTTLYLAATFDRPVVFWNDGYSLYSELHANSLQRAFTLPELLLNTVINPGSDGDGDRSVDLQVYETPGSIMSEVTLTDVNLRLDGEETQSIQPREYLDGRYNVRAWKMPSHATAYAVEGKVRFLAVQSILSIPVDQPETFEIPDWGRISVSPSQVSDRFVHDGSLYTFDEEVRYVEIAYFSDSNSVSSGGDWAGPIVFGQHFDKESWVSLCRELQSKSLVSSYRPPRIDYSDVTEKQLSSKLDQLDHEVGTKSARSFIVYANAELPAEAPRFYLAKSIPVESSFVVRLPPKEPAERAVRTSCGSWKKKQTP